MTVRIRPATSKDVPALTGLWRELVGYHVALGGQDFRLAPGADEGWKKFVRGHLGRKDKICLVADSDGGIVGFLIGSVQERPGVFMERTYGRVSDVYMQTPFRGKGIGKALVEDALEWFRARRIARVRLQTDARNSLGVDFWTKMGWETTVYVMDKLL